MDIFWTTALIAQRGEGSWEQLLYLLIFLVFPLLSQFGQWIREKAGAKKQTDANAADADASADPKPMTTVAPPERPKRARRAKKVDRGQAPPSAPQGFPPFVVVEEPPRSLVPPPVARPAPPPPRVAPPPREDQRAAEERAIRQAAIQAIVEKSKQEEPVDAIVLEPHATDRRRRNISRRDLKRRELRRAIVINEILQPPVALRGEQAGLGSDL